jgi:hypothetical protein
LHTVCAEVVVNEVSKLSEETGRVVELPGSIGMIDVTSVALDDLLRVHR